jgi:hypothetical protein
MDDRHMTLDIWLTTYTTGEAIGAGAGERKRWQYLPQGYIWYLEYAYLMTDTNKAASATNCNIWYLYDESGNAMCSLSGATILTAKRSPFGSVSATYRQIDASAAEKGFYAGFANSGAGETPMTGVHIVTRWSALRPGIAQTLDETY